MSLKECKITVPGRHVRKGYPNEHKEVYEGSRGICGNTTRPWHTNTRPIIGFMRGMAAYGKPIAEHLEKCGSCSSEYVQLIVKGEVGSGSTFAPYDRHGVIPKTLFKAKKLSKDQIPKAFASLGFGGIQWLIKNGARSTDVIATAVMCFETNRLKLTVGDLLRTPMISRAERAKTWDERVTNFKWEEREAWRQRDLIRNPQATIPKVPGVKFAKPDQKALRLAQYVRALRYIGSSVPNNWVDLAKDGKAAMVLIEVNEA